MSLFNFGRKKAHNTPEDSSSADGEHDRKESHHEVGHRGREKSVAELIADNPTPKHDAVATEIGPFDGDTVSIDEFDFSDFAMGVLDMGSLKIAVPKECQIQVEMGPQAPKALHIVSPFGRLTPVAFAAPVSVGQWDESALEIVQTMHNDGLTVTVERGTWGNEIVGRANDAVVRVIGVDAPRWMLRMTVASPTDTAVDAANLARQTIARTFVYRGSDPIIAGNVLPVVMPEALVEEIKKNQQARAASQNNAHKFVEAATARRRANMAPPATAMQRIAEDSAAEDQ